MKLIGTKEIKEAGGIETEKDGEKKEAKKEIGEVKQELGIKKIDENALNKNDKNPSGFTGKLRELVRKAIDCCIE